ncbi:hypothetical protein CDAR_369421 [Caerostris darwini]|uniref:Uncharacterized protein n=1 Tax=Caerostris darwini TaxID=1538125 RepID=A0AAV4S195_9ARAC|nr:hypothetical protein CDAR_369421 [Caerostris darwini]
MDLDSTAQSISMRSRWILSRSNKTNLRAVHPLPKDMTLSRPMSPRVLALTSQSALLGPTLVGSALPLNPHPPWHFPREMKEMDPGHFSAHADP